jgi:hypothetical protein
VKRQALGPQGQEVLERVKAAGDAERLARITWVFLRDDRLICDRCGAEQKLDMPVEIREAKAMGDAFALLHKDCKTLPSFAYDPRHPPSGEFVLSEDGTRWEPKP